MDQQSTKKGLTYGIVIAILVIAVIAAVAKYSFKKTDEVSSTTDVTPSSTITPEPTVSPVTTESPEATDSNSTYKDGTYSATGVYVSPGGGQKLNVTVTLKNDIITSASATSGAIDPMSENYQQKFISGFKTLVVGKNIADVKLDKVSGSSLTPSGFNDAIVKIEAKAKA